MSDENPLPSGAPMADDSPDFQDTPNRSDDSEVAMSVKDVSPEDPDTVVVSKPPSDEEDFVQVSNSYAELLKRRSIIAEMMEEAKANLKEGLPYCLLPTQWFYNLMSGNFDQNDESIDSKIGPIDTLSLLDETQLLVDDNAQYVSVPENCFDQLKEWYGLQEGSFPVVRHVIFENGIPTVDTFLQLVHPHILCSPELVETCRQIGATPFLISKRNTLKQLKDKMVALFNLSEIPSRIWSIRFNQTAPEPVILSPHNVDRLQSKQLLPTSKKTGMKANTLKQMDKSIHILIETQYNGDWIMNQVSFLRPGTGLVGLNNLGNTCYMNSALQCLVHIPELLYYFLYDFYEKEINVNNPLGNQGKVAISYANLIKHLFDPKEMSSFHGAISPRDFKTTIGYFNSMFADYHQQDSQEFIAFLLDGLHEDLNRILNKPYVEKPELEDGKSTDYNEIKKLADSVWDAHKQRNSSVVVDLFVGMYKSTVICPDCGKVSITFDPYNDLTLPLPVEKKWNHKVKVLLEEGFPQILEVELPKSSTFTDLKHYVSAKINIPLNELIALELFNSQVYKNFESNESDIRYLPISDLISSHDDIWFYQVKHKSGDLVVPVFNTIASESNANFSKAFGIPFFITLEENECFSYGSIRRKLEKRFSQLSTYDYFEKVRGVDKERFKLSDFPLLLANKEQTSHVSMSAPSNSSSAEAGEDECTEKVDDGNDSDCASDISLANPKIPGNYGFNIKLFDSSKEPRNLGYNRYGRHSNLQKNSRNNLGYGRRNDYYDAEEDEDDDALWIPNTNNNFSRLPDLLDRLPERKRAFYTYDESLLNRQTNEAVTENEAPAKSDVEQETQYNLPSVDIARVSSDVKLAEPEGMSLAEQASDILSEDLPNSSPIVIPSDSEESSMELNLETLTGNDDEITNYDDDTKMTEVGEFAETAPDANEGTVSLQDIDDELEKVVKLVDEKNALVCQWDQESFDTFFTGIEDEGHGGVETWTKPTEFVNEELETIKRKRAEQLKKNITLDDCMNLFSSEEVLGEHDLWFCPSCKEHRQASKKLEIWSTPDILTIQLKRFENQKSFSDKISATVDFPIEGLDMSKYIVSESGDNLIYDLFAVDNHYGGLGGGHYTAYVKNFLDNRWYYYDDSRVTPADPQNAVQGSAYLLFYRRRSTNPLGGEFFQKIMMDINEKEKKAYDFRKWLEREVTQNDTKAVDVEIIDVDADYEYNGSGNSKDSSASAESTSSLSATTSKPTTTAFTQLSIPLTTSDYSSVESESGSNLNNSESGLDSPAEDVSSNSLHELKRRKKMKKPLKPRGSAKPSELDLLDSGVASPLTDDDNVSTYSFSTTIPASVNDNDDVNSIIGEYNS